MADNLPPPEETLLLATRCFGRDTPFPYTLMKKIVVGIQDYGVKKPHFVEVIAIIFIKTMYFPS